jgi:peptidoglycan hydrolase-like protein with peptidoglycan-binding domain
MTISAAVGAGGANRAADVYTVQFLLNVARARVGLQPIGLDGNNGPETIGAIRDFQHKSFGPAKVDGRIDPGYATFLRLLDIHDEPALTSPKTFTRGKDNRYKVTVGVDGRIFVQPGDWLSKYSAAIYGDYFHIYDFARMQDGKLHLLRDANTIRAGEVIYHLPTWRHFMQGKNKGPIPEQPQLTKEEKERITKQATQGDFQLRGEHGIKVADAVAEVFAYGEPVVEILSWLIPQLGGVATAVSIIGIPFSIYGNLTQFLNASASGERQYSMRAAAYAITAWAFDDPPPSKSPAIWNNFKAAPLSSLEMQRLQRAWDTSASAARTWHEQFARERLGSSVPVPDKEKAWKAVLRKLSDQKKAKLSELLMKDLGDKALTNVLPTVREAWQKNMVHLYPE